MLNIHENDFAPQANPSLGKINFVQIYHEKSVLLFQRIGLDIV